ncbi:hypothetical protein Hanom_Chr09g00804121 [Helianthus anomalus]
MSSSTLKNSVLPSRICILKGNHIKLTIISDSMATSMSGFSAGLSTVSRIINMFSIMFKTKLINIMLIFYGVMRGSPMGVRDALPLSSTIVFFAHYPPGFLPSPILLSPASRMDNIHLDPLDTKVVFVFWKKSFLASSVCTVQTREEV